MRARVNIDVHHGQQYEIALLAQELRPWLPWAGATRLYFRHTYLRVSIAAGGAVRVRYIDGVPQEGFLAVRIGTSPYYNFGGECTLWRSGLSEDHAAAARALLAAASNFPERRFRYLLAASNSNSATRCLLRRSGLRLPRGQRIRLACDPRYAGWLLGCW
jgi:hypothetical protein